VVLGADDYKSAASFGLSVRRVDLGGGNERLHRVYQHHHHRVDGRVIMVHRLQVAHGLVEQGERLSGFGQARWAGRQQWLQCMQVAYDRSIVVHVEYLDDLSIHTIDPVQDDTFHFSIPFIQHLAVIRTIRTLDS